MKTKSQPEWEKRFDEKFTEIFATKHTLNKDEMMIPSKFIKILKGDYEGNVDVDINDIKEFIRQQRKEAVRDFVQVVLSTIKEPYAEMQLTGGEKQSILEVVKKGIEEFDK